LINEAKDNKKKLRKEINGKFGNTGSTAGNQLKKYHCSNFFLCQKLKFRVSFIQLKSVLDISCVVSVSKTALNTV
jgi:hypothetical protein